MLDLIATFEREGFTIKARTHYDNDATPPWEESDCHGPVSEWTGRPKASGERVLCSSRNDRRYYDFAEAVKIARRDGRGDGKGTKGEQAARAAEADFEYLRSWCNDEWHYVGVILSVEKNGIELDGQAASLWRVEDNCPAYLESVATELCDEAVQAGHEAMAKLIS